jgi:small nuclear ribonucleoprotein (snRNP)-like protein
MDMGKIEQLLNIKLTDIEEVRGRVFPLFDFVEVQKLRLALIKDPTFVVVDEDVYEKKLKGNYVVIDTNDGYIAAKYDGEPRVEALRLEKAEKEADIGKEDGKGSEERESGRDDIKEILEKMPKWADGAVVIRKDSDVVVLPIKKSKKGDSYYASVSWKPIEVSGSTDNLVGHVITRNGKVVKADLRINDKYVNIFIR